jgi:membrane-bound metal-dependent hydrolase YbcI (DUF457 family)
MDTITHGIVGALIGKAFFAGRDEPATGGRPARSDRGARVAIVAATLGAIFPDCDSFAGPLLHNPFAIMEWHRNVTHSLVMLPVWAILLALGTCGFVRWRGWQAPSWPRLFLIYAVGLASHVFLDVITSFGIMVWSPIDYTRVAWDWMFILDFTLVALALVPQLVAWSLRRPNRQARRAVGVWIACTGAAFGIYALAQAAGFPFARWVVGLASALVALAVGVPAIEGWGFHVRRSTWCRAGFVLTAAYIALAGVAHHAALQRTEAFAESHQLRVENLGALPQPPSVASWEGLVRTPEGVYRVPMDLRHAEMPAPVYYADTASRRAISDADDLHTVQVYLWFARFPWFHWTVRDGQRVLDISDLQFVRITDRQQGAPARSGVANFTMEVDFDRAGHAASAAWAQPEH